MKIFQNRAVAWVVLVLAVIGSVCIGLARKDSFLAKEPTKLPEVRYQQWIRDDAELLSEETEKTVRDSTIPRGMRNTTLWWRWPLLIT